jgi:hypothetical protein
MTKGKKKESVQHGSSKKPVKAATAKKTNLLHKEISPGEIGIGTPVSEEELKKMKEAAAKHKGS